MAWRILVFSHILIPLLLGTKNVGDPIKALVEHDFLPWNGQKVEVCTKSDMYIYTVYKEMKPIEGRRKYEMLYPGQVPWDGVANIFVCLQLLPSIMDTPIHALTSYISLYIWFSANQIPKFNTNIPWGGHQECVQCVISPHSRSRVYHLNSNLPCNQNSSFHCDFDLTGGVVNGPHNLEPLYPWSLEALWTKMAGLLHGTDLYAHM